MVQQDSAPSKRNAGSHSLCGIRSSAIRGGIRVESAERMTSSIDSIRLFQEHLYEFQDRFTIQARKSDSYLNAIRLIDHFQSVVLGIVDDRIANLLKAETPGIAVAADHIDQCLRTNSWDLAHIPLSGLLESCGVEDEYEAEINSRQNFRESIWLVSFRLWVSAGQ